MPAANAICARHHLDGQDLRRAVLGTNIVFHTQGYILKLFCRLWEDAFTAEYCALKHVQGLPTPQVVAAGELEGWPYLVMSCLPGIPALDVWNRLDEDTQAAIIWELGRMLRQLHGHPAIAALATDWSWFLQERIARAEGYHGVDEPWRSWIRERLTSFCEPPFEPVLLHADLTEDHLLLGEREGVWRITGLIDFADAKMGHAYYDFVAPLAFFTFGRPHLSRTLIEGYGLRLTAELAERLTTYCLLHEFGRVQDFLVRYPVADGRAFHRALWGDL